MKQNATPSQPPSANWLALQKGLTGKQSQSNSEASRDSLLRKRRKIVGVARSKDSEPSNPEASLEDTDFSRGSQELHSRIQHQPSASMPEENGNESLDSLRKMVLGKVIYNEAQMLPGKFVSIDCEMVGVGLEGRESSLARVSIVNFYGSVLLDEFVRQRERVGDYRTFVSGIRPEDLINAKSFIEVQKQVASILDGRILVGHAVYNDLRALLLSHPRSATRDTQALAGKARLLKTKFPALRKLVQHDLGLEIQRGEHSSVTDARATMAIYRLHRKEWDKSFGPPVPYTTGTTGAKKRKEPVGESANEDASSNTASFSKGKNAVKRKDFPGGGRKGVSSGLSTVIKGKDGRMHNGESTSRTKNVSLSKDEWWTTLGDGASSSGAKGSLKIRTG